MSSLTVISANLRNPYFTSRRINRAEVLTRLEAFARLAEEANAGLLLLQEVGRGRAFRIDEWLGERLAMDAVYERANGDANRWGREEGLAVLSRYPLHRRMTTLLAGGLWRRPALGAVAALPWGEVAAYTTHHSLRPWRNRRQPARLRAWVAATAGGRTALIGGDFNAGEDAPQIRALAGDWVDAWRATHPVEKGPTHKLKLGGWAVARRLDYLWLRPGTPELRIVDCNLTQSEPEPFSDHLTVVARLTFIPFASS